VVSRSANADVDAESGETGVFGYGGFGRTDNVAFVNFNSGRQVVRTLTCGIEFPRFAMGRSKRINPDWLIDIVREEDGNRVRPEHFRWVSYVASGKSHRLEVKNARVPRVPAWAIRSLLVHAVAPTTPFRVLRCLRDEPCDQNDALWPVINPAASLAALQAQAGPGYTLDAASQRIYLKLTGEDRLRFARQ
jgi:hypothetical protein